MRNLFPAVLTGALLCAVAFAQSASPSSSTPSTPQAQPVPQSEAQPQTQQQPEPQPAPPPVQAPAPAATGATQAQTSGSPRIAPGSVIPVQLTKTIDAKKAKPGDQVVAKVTMDLKTNSGEVLVPKDTKVTGHITEAQARSKDKESQVGIAFDHAALKSGDVSLPMSIQAVIAPPSNNASNGRANEEAAPAAGGGAATSPAGGGGRNVPTGQTSPSSAAPASPSSPETAAQSQSGARPPITGNTQGVV